MGKIQTAVATVSNQKSNKQMMQTYFQKLTPQIAKALPAVMMHVDIPAIKFVSKEPVKVVSRVD